MAENIITLTIEKLAGLGDGTGQHEGRKVFVPMTLAGDTVRAKVVSESGDFIRAELLEVLTPGPDRVTPPCIHFGTCGGCTLQHMAPEAYRAFKQEMARQAVRKAGFDMDLTAPMISFPPAIRRRAEMKNEDGNMGFYALNSHTLVDITECHVLEPELFALLMSMKPHLEDAPHITAVQVNKVDQGYDVLLTCSVSPGKALIAAIATIPAVTSISIDGKSADTLFSRAAVMLTIADVSVPVPPGAFLQVSPQSQDAMTALVVQALQGAKHIADLFSGIGTFSFPLAANAEVTAFEGEAPMVKAVQDAAIKSQKKVKAARRNLYTHPLTPPELKKYDGVVINPPRTGAKAQCDELAKAKVPKIVMVSCNPATFARDARILKEAGYRLLRATPIDQFTWSPHLEIIAELTT